MNIMYGSVFIVVVFVSFIGFGACRSLENRLERLEKQVSLLSSTLQECEAKAISRREGPGPVVAFSATISATSITPVAVYENIIYDNIILNTGNAYNNHVGRFQAPERGIYHFVATIMSYSNEYIAIELVHDGSVLCRARASERYNAMGTCVANVHMVTGSDVWVRHYGSEGNYIYGHNFPSFAGHLIQIY